MMFEQLFSERLFAPLRLLDSAVRKPHHSRSWCGQVDEAGV